MPPNRIRRVSERTISFTATLGGAQPTRKFSSHRIGRRSLHKAALKSPTSSPLIRHPDTTIASTLPYLSALLSTPGNHNIACFLLNGFARYLGLRHDIAASDEVDDSDRVTLEKMKDMIALAKTIGGINRNGGARFHVINKDPKYGSVQGCWQIVIPTYDLPEDGNNRQLPTLNLGRIKLVQTGPRKGIEECAADALPTEEYELMLRILISHIIHILGSDCVPVVMRPIVTAELKEYIEPLTRMGKWDSIEFPAIDDKEMPRFRLLGLSDQEVRRRGWVREGPFGWSHVKDDEQDQKCSTGKGIVK